MGQGIGTPPRACPFVALEEDRDRRASAPDPRHRCYAVAPPQPRALAHQDAYCLSSAFPSCTFFLDWAARAAANPVSGGVPAAASMIAAGPGAEEALDPLGRPWATPPPWVAHPELTTTRPSAPPNEQIGAFADASDHAFDHDLGVPDLPQRPASPPQPAYQPPPERPPPAAYQPPPESPPPAAYQPPIYAAEGDHQPAFAGAPAASAADTWTKPSGPFPGEPVPPALPSDTALSGRLTGRPVDSGPPPRIDLRARPTAGKGKGKGKDGSADWARPKRFEAYPTLGRRIRLRGISPILVGLFALMIAALVLFLLPGFLSGRGTGAAGSLKPSVIATVAAPTPSLAPTPQSYTVKSGDTLSRIAKNFGLTAEQIACFNGIKVTSILQIHQVLLIPPADYTCGQKGGTPKPSATPKPSTSQY